MNDCKKADGTTYNKWKKNKTINSNLHVSPNAVSFRMQDVPADGNTNCAADQKKDFKLITGLCPVQKVKVMDSSGTLVEMLVMIDSGSNKSLLSKNAAE